MPLPLLRVTQPGLLTTIQDQGRTGYQRDGIPVSGAMDAFASQVANILVGNARTEAVLEVTLLGPVLNVLHDCDAALCGGDLGAEADDAALPLWKSFRLVAGQIVRFTRPRDGARAYLAVRGGFDIPTVLGSKSTYLPRALGGHDGRALRVGDILHGRPDAPRLPAARSLIPAEIPVYRREEVLRVVMGPQDAAFTAEGISTFLTATYEVTPTSDRMGCRLNGPPIGHTSGADILSEAVPFGAIQIPADGLPIILMADRPTTGGYPKIATVISVDLPILAQVAPGRRVSFRSIPLEEAQSLLIERERLLRLWESVCRMPERAGPEIFPSRNRDRRNKSSNIGARDSLSHLFFDGS